MGIISGLTYLHVSGNVYIVKEASLLTKHMAEDVYEKKLKEALSIGVLSEKEFEENLIERGMWSKEEEEALKEFPKAIEETKFQLYSAYKSYRSRDSIKKSLEKQKFKMIELLSKKNILRSQSAEGMADAYKYRYIICSNVTDIDGNKLWNSEESFNQESRLSDSIVAAALDSSPNEIVLRELSRTDPWRTLWLIRKSENGVFGKPARDLTSSQQSIISWSRVYDIIFESPECPLDEVLEDDDLLDGWLIYQGRKRKESQKQQSSSESLSGVKGDEVFIMAGDANDASRIYSLNSADSRKIVKHRQKQIASAGNLEASKTLDAQMELQQQAIEGMKSVAKRK